MNRRAENSPPVSNYRVKKVISHPDSYNSNDKFHVNDIALLQVERINSMDDGSFVPEPICMPEGERVAAGTTCYAIGWGHTQLGCILLVSKSC